MPTPKKPSKVLELSGAFKKNPQRKPMDEPQQVALGKEPPAYLKKNEKQIWMELVSIACPGVLTLADQWVVETAVRLMTIMRVEGINGITAAQLGHLLKCLSQLGMTPADRSRLSVPPQKEPNEWDDI